MGKKLRIHAFWLIALLIVQYMLGMFTNLFVEFPKTTNSKQLWDFAGKQLPLAAHMFIGFGLLLGTIALLIRSFLFKEKKWMYASSVSLFGMLGAVASGIIFIPTQTDVYSYSMSLFFIVAFVGLGWGIYATRR